MASLSHFEALLLDVIEIYIVSVDKDAHQHDQRETITKWPIWLTLKWHLIY